VTDLSLVLLELILAVAAVGFGLWQLYDVNRALREDRENATDAGRERDP